MNSTVPILPTVVSNLFRNGGNHCAPNFARLWAPIFFWKAPNFGTWIIKVTNVM